MKECNSIITPESKEGCDENYLGLNRRMYVVEYPIGAMDTSEVLEGFEKEEQRPCGYTAFIGDDKLKDLLKTILPWDFVTRPVKYGKRTFKFNKNNGHEGNHV